MSKSPLIIAEIPSLTEKTSPISGEILNKRFFKGDRRAVLESLQRFVIINERAFSFLNIEPIIEGVHVKPTISFRTNQYIGAISTRSPITGVQIGDLFVAPKYSLGLDFSNYLQIINLINAKIEVEQLIDLPLKTDNQFRIPKFFEAIKYIKSLEALEKRHWLKFSSISEKIDTTRGKIDWTDYSRRSSQPKERLHYKTRINRLTENHLEHAQLNWVFRECLMELSKPGVPRELIQSNNEAIRRLIAKFTFIDQLPVDAFNISANELPIIRDVKKCANQFLSSGNKESIPWRVDFSLVFEKYVQYLFDQAKNLTGGNIYVNPRLHSSFDNNIPWGLKYLEPDCIYEKDGKIISIDSKYKSNLLNLNETSDRLKDDFRRDLHQVLAYSSFDNRAMKQSVICYPSLSFLVRKFEYKNPINAIS
ncbi:MAG: 5-methylcytosine restriction system specificity protein McrC, partial [Anaerolineaceae bacterium]